MSSPTTLDPRALAGHLAEHVAEGIKGTLSARYTCDEAREALREDWLCGFRMALFMLDEAMGALIDVANSDVLDGDATAAELRPALTAILGALESFADLQTIEGEADAIRAAAGSARELDAAGMLAWTADHLETELGGIAPDALARALDEQRARAAWERIAAAQRAKGAAA